MSNELDIGGRFGVIVKDSQGREKHHFVSKNLVVDRGVQQLHDWLNRPEFVRSSPNFNEFGDPIYCVGENKRITVWKNLGQNTSYWYSYPYRAEKAFDGGRSTYTYNTLNSSVEEYLDVYFDQPINLKKVGLVPWGWEYYDGCPRTYWQVKQAGFSVSGAGTTAYNLNEYILAYSEYNGHPYYKNYSGSFYIHVDAAEEKWVLSTSLGGAVDYQTDGTVLPEKPSDGSWGAISGTPPAPTVTEGTASWRRPVIYRSRNSPLPTGYMTCSPWKFDSEGTSTDPASSQYIGKHTYAMLSPEAPREISTSFSYNGFLPNVVALRIRCYGTDRNRPDPMRLYECHVYEEIMHPQNPYALKLGTDDGAILPLAAGNTALGAAEPGMSWIVDAVRQTGYTVRYEKTIPQDEANGITFKEIGLFMNGDAHLPGSGGFTEPARIGNASDLFARSVFDVPWTKNEDETVVIYYDIGVQEYTPSSSSSA